jgi:hypothetical protein
MSRPLRVLALLLPIASVCAEALAIDLPKRKSGLWDIKISRASTNRPSQAMQMCIDQQTDDMAQQLGESVASQACSKQKIHREGDRIVADSVCKLGDTTATSRTVLTGKFDRTYRGEIRTKYDPPLMGRSENLTLIEAKWVGPCQPDQKPGDMIMPNGMKINIRQMQSKP